LIQLLIIVSLISIAAITGCGSSQYEARFQDSLTKLRNEIPFNQLWPKPVGIPLSFESENIVLEYRVPRLFDTKTKASYALDRDTPDPRNPDSRVNSDRLWPDFLRFGTHLRTYEITLNFENRRGKNERSSIHCYLSVMARSDEVDFHGILSKRIAEKLEKSFDKNTKLTKTQTQTYPKLKSGVGDWIALSVPTPDGKKREIERLQASGNIQLFSYVEHGKPEIQNKTTLATCSIFIVRSGKETVILSWLLPVDLAVQKNITESALTVPIDQLPVARAMAGTVQARDLPAGTEVPTN